MTLSTRFLTVLPLLVAAATATLAQDVPDIRNLVVNIHTTHRVPDVLRPWTKRDPAKSSGSGTVIAGNRILTNAHVVRNGAQIYVQPFQSSDMLEAHVVGFSPRIDLAVIELEDETFFADRPGMPISEVLPKVRETINVYGYPTGGDELSVTEGIVSRIEFAPYYFDGRGLRLQVDAPLNPGNSGGPAVIDGQLVGLVFSGIPQSQNIGYLIPGEEINMFLADIEDDHYDGKPMLLEAMQTVENDAIRQRLQLPDDTGGLMIIDPAVDDTDYPLRRWDVITQIGEYPLDRQGNVLVDGDLRLNAMYLLQQLAEDGHLPCTIMRDGEEMSLNIPVQYERKLVLPYLFEDDPRYFIYGPLVFSQATQDHLARFNERGRLGLATRGNPLITRRSDAPAFPGEEVVIVTSQPFSHPLMKGYSEPFLFQVREVNGIAIKNLVHLVEVLRDNTDPQVVFVFGQQSNQTPEILVFDHQAMLDATEEVLNENGIRYRYSEDIRQVWEQKR